VTYFCSIGSQILYIFETHGIGQTPSSLERYLVSTTTTTIFYLLLLLLIIIIIRHASSTVTLSFEQHG